MQYVISIDSSSSACKAYLIDKEGNIHKQHSIFLNIFSPNEGWYEHDPLEIWNKQLEAIEYVISGINKEDILGIGISTQRETVVAWDKDTLEPVYNAISWQDNRNKDFISKYRQYSEYIRVTTGAYLNEYFSVSKIQWILFNIKYPIEKIRVGTLDTWLITKLTSGREFFTDVTNASRTLLMDIDREDWSDELLNIFSIPKHILPCIKSSGSCFGYWKNIPIYGVIGDQQASLLSCGFKFGLVKCTYGTGIFILGHLGTNRKLFNNFITTIAWKIGTQPTYYSLEIGSFVGGNLLSELFEQNYFDSYELNNDLLENAICLKTKNNRLFIFDENKYEDLFWNIDLEKNKGDIVLKSALNAISLVVFDLLWILSKHIVIKYIYLHGRASTISYLSKMQANLLKREIFSCRSVNNSALGAAYLVFIYKGLLNIEDIKSNAISFFNTESCSELLYIWRRYKPYL